jgi:hypothetical protein
MKKQFMKRREADIPKKKATLEMVLEKLNNIILRLDAIENDLRELTSTLHPEREEEKKPTPEFFMEK